MNTIFIRHILIFPVVLFNSCEANQAGKPTQSTNVLNPVIHYHYADYGRTTTDINHANTVLRNYESGSQRRDRSFMSGLLSAFTFGLFIPEYKINVRPITLQNEEDYTNSITYISIHQCN